MALDSAKEIRNLCAPLRANIELDYSLCDISTCGKKKASSSDRAGLKLF
tara:strand:+ start:98 stop:244 length:147 start_codon:yes stop_codon:yes gene_type:complete